MFHDSQGAYPPARLVPAFGDDNQTCMGPASWAVHLLPFIDQQNLYDLWDFSIDYEDQPEAAVATPVQLFLCSSRHTMSNANAPDLIVAERGGGGG